MEEKLFLVFKSTRDVIISEKECKNAGFDCTAVPVPREHSSQCGIALEVPVSQKEEVFKLLNSIGRRFEFYQGKQGGKSCGL